MIENQINETTVDTETAGDYIDVINNLKQNSVDRAQYDKLRAENKRLLETLVNGQTLEQPKEVVKPDINALRNSLFNEEPGTNLNYIEKALQLRNALIENGETDPFLPIGKQIMPTDEDVATANRVAEVLADCVEYAQGDSQVFTNELSRRTLDIRIR